MTDTFLKFYYIYPIATALGGITAGLFLKVNKYARIVKEDEMKMPQGG